MKVVALLALMSKGWTVAQPTADESFDFLAKDPLEGEWRTCVVATEASRTGADYTVIVITGESGLPRVCLLENEHYIELPIELNQTVQKPLTTGEFKDGGS